MVLPGGMSSHLKQSKIIEPHSKHMLHCTKCLFFIIDIIDMFLTIDGFAFSMFIEYKLIL